MIKNNRDLINNYAKVIYMICLRKGIIVDEDIKVKLKSFIFDTIYINRIVNFLK